MKIIPKFQNGGGFGSFFTVYTPTLTLTPKLTSEEKSTRRSGREDDDEDNLKGKLTEKLLFDMISKIDGLPNEMIGIIRNLLNTFALDNLVGVDPTNLATTYLSSLYQLKIAEGNKKKYDEALSAASKSGALNEPAISTDGKLIVQTLDGLLETISLDEYFNDTESYQPLTVSNLARLRAYDPSLNNNLSIFDILNNSIGFEEFLALVDSVRKGLGTNGFTRNGLFTNEGEASKGLLLLNTLKNDDKAMAVGSAGIEELYEYKIIDKTQALLLKALTLYITTVLPNRAKTWAALKTDNPNKNKATQDLVFTYLFSGTTQSYEFDILYKGSTDKVTGNSKSSKGSLEDPEKGFWSQVLSGLGGDDFRFTILSNKGSMSVDGKFYGTTPGLDNNKSLGDYINDSRVGYLIKNNKNITFGDKKLSIDSFNDVMVSSAGGSVVVTLPIKVDGTVDLDITERWTDIIKELENSGLTPNTPEYINKLKQLLEKNHLNNLVDSYGNLNINRFGLFLVLEGYTSEKAKIILDNKKINFNDIESNYIISAGDDNEIYDMIEKGLSNKDRGEYKFNRNWDWSIGYDNLYKGNIYIPLNTNPINGYNADKNNIKESTSYLYERALLLYSTSSNEL